MGRSAHDRAGGHVELAAVADARDDRSGEMALGERAAHVGTGVVERVEMAARIRHIHAGSTDLEDPHLAVLDIRRGTDPFLHCRPP